MERLTVAECRKLIGQPTGQSLADDGVLQLRDMIYSLADVITDAFSDLENTDPEVFQPDYEPTEDAVDIFEMRVQELIENISRRDT